jgi:hypothetical protein
LPEERLLSVGVECYAGHRGEQTPRTLILGDRRITVAEVLDAWLAPDYRYFKLKGADGNTYLVRHDERSNTWELPMFRAERVDGPRTQTLCGSRSINGRNVAQGNVIILRS